MWTGWGVELMTYLKLKIGVTGPESNYVCNLRAYAPFLRTIGCAGQSYSVKFNPWKASRQKK